MRTHSPSYFLRIALVALPLALLTSGCDSFDFLDNLNFFEQKKKPLEGERKPVFPGGVPGVEHSAPPAQPTNSNIPLSAVQNLPSQNPAAAEPEAQPKGRAGTRPATRPAPSGQADDPWSEARPQAPASTQPQPPVSAQPQPPVSVQPQPPVGARAQRPAGAEDPWAEARPVR